MGNHHGHARAQNRGNGRQYPRSRRFYQRPRNVFDWTRDFFDSLANGSPARLATVVFILVILVFAVLLMLPISSSDGKMTTPIDALFTAVSAICVTGLTVVSTAAHWSFFGQLVILIGIFIGGSGTLALASVLALVVSKRLGVRGKLIANEALNNAGRLGEVGTLLKTVIVSSVITEAVIALMLFPRLLVLGEPVGQAAWHSVFYAISAFNNAGFTPHSDGLVPYQNDFWVIFPLELGVFVGSLGFPVMMVLVASRLRPRKWNLHTKLTLLTTTILLVLGSVLWGALEWGNAHTIGGFSAADKVQHSVFASVMMRSGGFNLVDMMDQHSATRLLTDALMFAGGGSASTAGGIKVTTIAVVFLAIVAEAQGVRDMRAFGRTIALGTLRVAISVIALGATLVLIGTGLLLLVGNASLDRTLFETISAFATCGLSTGLSQELNVTGKLILCLLMFAGRVGTVTLAAALALRQRRQLYHYPEERPIIG